MAALSTEHDYRVCDDDDCPRFPCRVYKEGWADGHAAGSASGYASGYSDGYSEGEADGYTAGVASADG